MVKKFLSTLLVQQQQYLCLEKLITIIFRFKIVENVADIDLLNFRGY